MESSGAIRSRSALLVLIVGVAVNAVGCRSGGGTDQSPTGQGGSGGAGDTAGSAATGGGASATGTAGAGNGGGNGGGGGAAGGLEQLDLSDGEIAAVVTALNTSEIQQAQLAMMRASDGEVLVFATRLVEEHTDATTALNGVLADRAIVSTESELSQQIWIEWAQVLAALQSQAGAEFELAYMQAQVPLHERSLEVINLALLPAVDDERLRGYLEVARPLVLEHLADAREIAAGLTESE
jgi:predicted outer membrane protein